MFRGSISDAFISATVQILLERTVSYFLALKRDRSEDDFGALLHRLRTASSSVAAALDATDVDSPASEWLDGVREAVFDADDLLDEIETDDALRRVSSEPQSAKRAKIFGLFCGDGERDSERIQRALERLEDVARQKELLGFSGCSDEVARPRPRQRLPSTSLLDESEVFGRNEEKNSAVEFLLEDCDKVGVVPIVGMGGVGKTALAQAVFNHGRVDSHFQVKEWVCVSGDFDICRVTNSMLEPGSNSESDLNSLQARLRQKLAGKRFLIVLDDVWSEDYLAWDALSLPFRDGARGSKVIVSTRSARVASLVGTVPGLWLDKLSGEAGWRLLARHALGRGVSPDPERERLGREIVRKCDGLPLAVKAVGGLLRSATDLWEWERVAESDLWHLSGVQTSVLPALRLSYSYLSPSLKRCFAYCSIFPKDYEFDKDELILLWMAEDLLDCPKQQSQRIEDVGEECFAELVSRSFLQRSRNSGSNRNNNNNKPVFLMHDLLVDLAKSVSFKYCFLSETSGSFDEALIAQARHFAYVPKQHYPYERFGSVLKATRLRTFLPVESMFSCTNLSQDVVEGLFSKLRRLRVLSLSGYKNITLLPDSIGNLKHLRYLNLSSTSITCLPKTTGSLYNLQTLKLACCYRFAELPKDFHCLVCLRHLDISSSGLRELPESLSLLSNLQTLKISRCRFLTKLPAEFHRLVNLRRLEAEESGLEEMPVRIGELKSLRALTTFTVGEKSGAEIGELGGLNGLRGTLNIKKLQNVKCPDQALHARLRDKKYLEGLKYEWGKRTGLSKLDIEVLDSLVPNTSLKKLEFVCYGGTEFSDWLGHQSFRNLVEMSLSNCIHCSTVPPLGQLPALKNLQIKGFDSVTIIGSEFYGEKSATQKPFASLEVLEMKEMRKWREWSSSVEDSEAFPKLRKLCIEFCNSLTGALPSFLPSLTELTVSMCDRLAVSLPTMPSVGKIELKMCQSLSRAVDSRALQSFTLLKHLEICANSLSITLDSLPASTNTLKLQGYTTLEFHLRNSSNSLEELSLDCNDEGVFEPGFTLDSFPNIRILRLGGCQNPAALWPSSGQSPESLSTLEIANCQSATAVFPHNAKPLRSLTTLATRNCRRLKHLSGDLAAVAPSLEALRVEGCPAMETLSGLGPLPPALQWLTLENCESLMASRGKWNLRGLERLVELTIGGCDSDEMTAFPDEWMVLPAAITELSIWYLEWLETLDSRALRRLVSLKQLLLFDCPNLAAMTDAALPHCLEALRVNRCPLLQENCRRETGKYWDNISHVPCIYFDYKLVSH